MKVVTIVLGIVLATANAANYPSRKLWHIKVPAAGVNTAETRVIGGVAAEEGQFPYQVGLSMSDDSGNSEWSGGSLISTDWVLTAAHSTYQKSAATVYLGGTEKSDARQTIDSTEFYDHPNYNSGSLSDDISLIKLPVKAVISDFVKPVALPSISSGFSSYHGQSVIVSGWGSGDNGNDGDEDLFYIVRTVNPNSECSLVYGPNVKDTNLCVGTSGHDNTDSTCNGDSGGPLVLDDPTPIQIGLMSYGSAADCEKGFPIVFTRVSSYLTWIANTTGISFDACA